MTQTRLIHRNFTFPSIHLLYHDVSISQVALCGNFQIFHSSESSLNLDPVKEKDS